MNTTKPTKITSRWVVAFWLICGLISVASAIVDLVGGRMQDAWMSFALGCCQVYIASLLALRRAGQARAYEMLGRASGWTR